MVDYPDGGPLPGWNQRPYTPAELAQIDASGCHRGSVVIAVLVSAMILAGAFFLLGRELTADPDPGGALPSATLATCPGEPVWPNSVQLQPRSAR